ncbi:hypothetical protein P167DRAFT_49216 [Morchella conica CCBAS932]|uniref:Uncharacterized protein n=1 Tax=Morchella conica CCBAS932 TaxID=1392247 RepID=A0A3N4K895_9PEZI|nr:hypothetical protein P167DRAFT_49216 [Morchella conica CCBAS932]
MRRETFAPLSFIEPCSFTYISYLTGLAQIALLPRTILHGRYLYEHNICCTFSSVPVTSYRQCRPQEFSFPLGVLIPSVPLFRLTCKPTAQPAPIQRKLSLPLSPWFSSLGLLRSAQLPSGKGKAVLIPLFNRMLLFPIPHALKVCRDKCS